MTAYLRALAEWCDDVIVVDGSPPEIFAEHGRLWGGQIRHTPPDPAHAALMGKVPGVLTGLDLVRHERVIIADDDVRYGRAELERVLALLVDYDLVRPQNFFSPLPWHALWDTARTLLNRAFGADFPGTLAVRRSILEASGGYDGDVLFENLELIRTVQANGGRVTAPLDLFVCRRPPTAQHFIGQRTRQAYDDFAIPVRMAIWLSLIPALLASMIRVRWRGAAVLGGGVVLLAERGRRRAGGVTVFPIAASAMAPLWVLERSVCAWLAIMQRVRFGGVRYGDSVIPVAAHSVRQLRQRVRTRSSVSRN